MSKTTVNISYVTAANMYTPLLGGDRIHVRLTLVNTAAQFSSHLTNLPTAHDAWAVFDHSLEKT